MFGRGKNKQPRTEIVIVVMAASGQTSSTETTAEPTMTIAEVLAKAGYSVEGMEVSVDGKPVRDLNQRVGEGAKVGLTPTEAAPAKEKRRVTLTERPAGS